MALALEWLAFLLRWLHIVAAIAWVGASFYFIWVENRLIRGGAQRSEAVAGHLWAIHGGGFYYLEKQRAAPQPLPPQLHWFKWEAYATWLSGAALMVVLYYVHPAVWLVRPDAPLPPAAGVALGVGYLAGGFAVYSALSRTALLRHPRWFGAVGLALVVASAYGLLQVFTPRAVFLHTGAMLATLMAGNVLMVIIPVQRRLVAAAECGGAPDAQEGLRAGLRSLHNNYLALPVVFLMIALHTPLLAAGALAPLTMALLILFAAGIRHAINLSNQGRPLSYGTLALSALCLLAALLLSLPPARSPDAAAGKVTMAQVRQVVDRHCISCHAARPADEVFRVAPLGYVMDTDEEVAASADKIYQRVVVDRSMPFNNQTGMDEDERQLIARWVEGMKK